MVYANGRKSKKLFLGIRVEFLYDQYNKEGINKHYCEAQKQVTE